RETYLSPRLLGEPAYSGHFPGSDGSPQMINQAIGTVRREAMDQLPAFDSQFRRPSPLQFGCQALEDAGIERPAGDDHPFEDDEAHTRTARIDPLPYVSFDRRHLSNFRSRANGIQAKSHRCRWT